MKTVHIVLSLCLAGSVMPVRTLHTAYLAPPGGIGIKMTCSVGIIGAGYVLGYSHAEQHECFTGLRIKACRLIKVVHWYPRNLANHGGRVRFYRFLNSFEFLSSRLDQFGLVPALSANNMQPAIDQGNIGAGLVPQP